MNTINRSMVAFGLGGLITGLYLGVPEGLLAFYTFLLVVGTIRLLWSQKSLEKRDVPEESNAPEVKSEEKSTAAVFVEASGGERCPPHPWEREKETGNLYCPKCHRYPGYV